MSLIKQLWIGTILLVVIIFAASLSVSISSSRDYLAEQLREKNIDNATSLALTMSQMEKDLVEIELLLSAQFDAGHYKRIELSDRNGNILVLREKEHEEIAAPDWFIRLVAMDAPPASAQVQDGWAQFGKLRIESDTRFAHEALWRGSQKMLLASLIIGVLGAFLGGIFLKSVLQPLKNVVRQAEAISERRFIVTEEPKTSEFRKLVRSMNRLTSHIRSMLEEESRRLEKLRLEVNYDGPSRLMNRSYFFNRIDALINHEEGFTEGALVVMRLHDLAGIDKILGHEDTNALLWRLGAAMEKLSSEDKNLIAGRVSGTDFAVFSAAPVDLHAFSTRIRGLLLNAAGLQQSIPDFRLPTVCSKFNKHDTAEDLYKPISMVLGEMALSNPDMLHIMSHDHVQSMQDQSELEWRQLLDRALVEGRVKLAHYPVIAPDGKVIHLESPVRMQLKHDGAWLAAGEFISWANRLNMVDRIDAMVIKKALEALGKGSDDIGLNISSRALCSPGFIEQARALVAGKPEHAHRLWLEVPERGVFEHLQEFRSFCNALKPLGCKIGIEHVGAYVSRLGELHDLGLDYIKIDMSVIIGIDSNTGNQAFLRGLCLIAHSIGLMTIAEGVQTDAELKLLPQLGIDGMTGPAIK